VVGLILIMFGGSFMQRLCIEEKLTNMRNIC